ncbi:hypothetical protein [Nocardia brasiliensis]|uniref:hypothetical protein n=1 Tax=Nocardia brasiliensis TaxID=37326 RepID=UPI002459038E|nr:hypothetical protein [Nocardia brasiliensis]
MVGSVRVPAFSDGAVLDAALVDSLWSGAGAWFVSMEFAGDVVSAAAGVVLSDAGVVCVSLGSAGGPVSLPAG